MESAARTIVKAISWQLLGLVSMAVIGYCYTGSIMAAGSLALVTALCGAVCYVLHERAWNRISWGRIDPVRAFSPVESGRQNWPIEWRHPQRTSDSGAKHLNVGTLHRHERLELSPLEG